MSFSGIENIASSQMNNLKAARAASNANLNKSDTKLMDACEQFESLFIKQMLNTMRKSVSKSGMINGGMTEDIFEDRLYDNYSEQMSKSGDFGLAKTMFNQMKALEKYGRSIASAPQSQGMQALKG